MSLFIGVTGTSLVAEDRARLLHPNCSGVILFSRNYANPEQLCRLVREIRHTAKHLLISVDHEGGRVQRFREGFTEIPAMGKFGALFDSQPILATQLTYAAGVVLAYELRACDIDFSYTPVLDLQDSVSSIIGERAFHQNPAVVAVLASTLRRGLAAMGMAAVGKHYPGHGRVQGDSHHVLPYDERDYAAREADRYPFYAAVQDNIEAIMIAHIMLPEDNMPAGFSKPCLDSLREMGFDGAIISDDLDMAGAHAFPDPIARVQACFKAGADVAMICNSFTYMDQALAAPLLQRDAEKSLQRLDALRAKKIAQADAQKRYAKAKSLLAEHSALL